MDFFLCALCDLSEAGERRRIALRRDRRVRSTAQPQPKETVRSQPAASGNEFSGSASSKSSFRCRQGLWVGLYWDRG
jgi:hypothetical protein